MTRRHYTTPAPKKNYNKLTPREYIQCILSGELPLRAHSCAKHLVPNADLIIENKRKDHLNHKKALAEQEDVTPEILNTLYRLEIPYIGCKAVWYDVHWLMYEICKNPNCPEEIREEILNADLNSSLYEFRFDEFKLRHQGLASNPTISSEHREILFKIYTGDKITFSVRHDLLEKLALNPSTSHDLLMRIADYNISVIAQRPDITPELVYRLLAMPKRDTLEYVIELLEKNPNTPFEYYKRITHMRMTYSSQIGYFEDISVPTTICGMIYHRALEPSDYIDVIIDKMEGFIETGKGDKDNLLKIIDFMYSLEPVHMRTLRRKY